MRKANFLKKSPKDKEEGDIEVTEKIKLPKLKSPGIARKYIKRKKEEFVKDEAEVHPVHGKKEIKKKLRLRRSGTQKWSTKSRFPEKIEKPRLRRKVANKCKLHKTETNPTNKV